MTRLNKKLRLVIILVAVLFIVNESAKATENEVFWLDGGSTVWGFTHAGYSDYFTWGESPRHINYSGGPHEMLSGEWAAAIWWQNCGSNQAYWLTNSFEYPNFPTYTIFQSVSVNGNPPYDTWDDSNNPIIGEDTGYATIQDNQNRIRIRMDFEVVDLGEQDADGFGGSPIAFRAADGTTAYVNSERYVLLQTYTIKNISDSNITGIEFYQLLHGHPADIQTGNFSSYKIANYYDPLSKYIPYNPVHKAPNSNYAGSFCYDISQWNSGDPNTEHVDWIGFSSTIPPDSCDTSTFPHASPPTTGTYVHIKNRSLNGQAYINNEQVAGALQWNLGEELKGSDTFSEDK